MLPLGITRFGAIELDPARYELRANGKAVALERIPMELLILLISRKGALVTRQEILDSIWGHGIHLSADKSINTAVRKLRQVLGDDPDCPKFIETIVGKGYRFVAPTLEKVEPPAAPPPGFKTETDSSPAERLSRRIWSVGIGAILLATGWAWLAFRPTPPSAVRSLAVLPFVNLSQHPDQEYISDGLTEEIINAVALMSGLKVVARTSAFQFKGKNVDVRTIGATLGADAILEGSVRLDGTRMRVTAQLNSTRDGYHYWSHAWEHAMEDVFSVEQQVAREVVEALGQQRGIPIPPVKPLTHSLEAHNYYLQGHHFKTRILEGMLPRAVEAFENALKADPGFAAAHAQIGQAYIWALQIGKIPAAQALPLVRQHVRQALAHDPNLALAHAVQADVSFFADWDFIAAERSFRRAIELNRVDADARHELSHFLIAMGRFKDAEVEAKQTAEMDPVSIDALTHLQLHFYMARDIPRAISAADRALAIDPSGADPLRYLQMAYEESGQFQKAIDTVARRPDLAANVVASLQRGFKNEGELGYWKAWCESRPVPIDEGARALALGGCYSRLGQNQEALEWLEEAVASHAINSVYLNVAPQYDRLRGLPRFQRLIRRIGLPEH